MGNVVMFPAHKVRQPKVKANQQTEEQSKKIRGMIGKAPTSYQAVRWIHRELEKKKRK